MLGGTRDPPTDPTLVLATLTGRCTPVRGHPLADGARRGRSRCGVAVGDRPTHLVDGRADDVAVGIVGECGQVVLRAVEVFRGCPERPETTEVVGQVQVQARIEARDAERFVVFPGALVGEGIGSVEGADIPDQGLGGIVVQVGSVGASVRVASRYRSVAVNLTQPDPVSMCTPFSTGMSGS